MKRITLIFIVLLALSVFSAQAQGDTVRVRLAHLSLDAGELDLFINGSPAFSANFGAITRYFEGGAGTYQLAVVPTGSDISAAVLGPADVVFEAGHSYTLAAIGQQADLSFSPLVIDETLTLQNAGITTSSPILLINAVSGAPALDVFAGDAPLAAQLSFGGYAAAAAPAGEFEISATSAGQVGNVIFSQTALGLPNNLLLVALAGGADDFALFSANTSGLNAIEFLTGLTGTVYSSDLLLSAINAAGLTDALANQGPFTLFAPLDSAFAALPADTMNAVLSDAGTLTNVLGYHIVPGYSPSADIVDGILTNGTISFTSSQGGSITISSSDGRVLLNDSAQLIGADYYVRNGVIHFIDGVLMP
ncbi:MAG: fasciclin domain-containing protein [Anaerolineae bacterium]